MNDMAEAHTRYHHAKDQMDHVRRAIEDLLAGEGGTFLSSSDKENLRAARSRLLNRAASIVSVWD